MSNSSNIIAWLVPTARGTFADKTAHMAENASRSISTSSSTHLTSHLTDLLTSRPQKAIQLAFDNAPKRQGSGFILGTDPSSCDVVLPSLAGISPQHCCIHFDHESRLVLEDFSAAGTQVWYDWECSGDQIDHTWLLSGGPSQGFPSVSVRRIAIDIQGIRFQVVVNDQSADWNAYERNVDEFCRLADWSHQLTADWDMSPFLMDAAPLLKHIFVQALGDGDIAGEFYLWDMTKPWEPMVKAVA